MNALEEHHKNSNPVQLLPQSASLAGPPHVQRGMDVHTCVHMVPGRKSDSEPTVYYCYIWLSRLHFTIYRLGFWNSRAKIQVVK